MPAIDRESLEHRLVAAGDLFARAIELAPKFALGWYGLSEALIQQKRIAEDVDARGTATVLMPKSPSREQVARALVHLGKTEEAIKHDVARQKEESNNPVTKHHIAALTQPDTAERASDAYVESVFDQFAATFDSELALLEYHTQKFATEAVKAVFPEPVAALDIADARGDKGLCGPLVLPLAKRLCGFDLSGGKLAQRYGQGGHIFYTLEAASDDGPPHQLNPSGRYIHAKDHIAKSAASAGLGVRSVQSVTRRAESGRPVVGWLVTLHRA